MKKLLSLVFGLILSMSSAFAETCDFNISSIYTSGTPTITSAGIYKTGNSQNYIRTQNDVNFSTANTWSFKWRFTYHPATNDQGIMSGNGETNVQAIINSEGRPRFSFGAGNGTWNAGVWNDTSISFRYQDSVTYDNEIYFNGTRYGFKVDGVEIGGIDSTEKAGNTYFAIGVERGRTGGQYSRAEWDLTNTSLIVDGVNQFLWCQSPIKIATTAYNSTRFSPVVNDLNSTIATIRDVVTNTINQTAAIADLQATKQTRPNETCPAGKKCLLVEDDAGQPHWYEIIENAYGLPNGYTALEYLQGKGSTHIVPGVTINSNLKIDIKYEILTPGWLLGGTTGESGRWGVTSSNTFFSGTSGVADISSATNLSGINTATFNYKTGATVNGVNIPFGTEQTYGNVTAKQFYLFSADGTGVSTQEHKIYYANIYNGETLVRSLVPAKRNSDNVLGMYDTVSGQFFTNQGSGTFVAGPEI